MFLDLDNFKPLNDTQGHVVGDLLLIEVSERLKVCVREVDTVARFGGDEFVVMPSELGKQKAASKAQVQLIAEKIHLSLYEPYRLTISHEDGPDSVVEHHCTASIGVVMFVDHHGEADEIISWADKAMYQAKENGRNSISFFQQDMHDK